MMIRRGRRVFAALNRPFAPNRAALFKTRANARRLTEIASYTGALVSETGKAVLHLCANGACSLSPPDTEAMVEQLLTA
jgi:hypothetical protein